MGTHELFIHMCQKFISILARSAFESNSQAPDFEMLSSGNLQPSTFNAQLPVSPAFQSRPVPSDNTISPAQPSRAGVRPNLSLCTSVCHDAQPTPASAPPPWAVPNKS